MEHANIISLNLRNMLTITIMATLGFFLLHLLGNLLGGRVGVDYSGSTSGSAGIDFGGGMPA